ncbi:MAG: hypothetical protein Q7V01_04535 [Vicinamibacterales bacterium]|nr:hypothetical protein [Vicinamibacterales bacterium]
MTVREALAGVGEVRHEAGAPPVVETVAALLAGHCAVPVTRLPALPPAPTPGVFIVSAAASQSPHDAEPGAVTIRLGRDGSGQLSSPGGRLLYAAARYLLEAVLDDDTERFERGVSIASAFTWNRSTYDIFLTQEARAQHGLDPESYVRELARWGFTHAEVNALAYPMGIETGPKGEVYPMFYTYCPAMDQFVYSSLNKGLYPFYYLSANLARLKRNAALARTYGLVPGLLCFEPRNVPEEFFARYPMLRGPRVDHPFRSFRPRYTMTLTHPLVRQHYADMMRALLHEVPDLGYISVWSNDSGAGFEHTKSLYVGRNGGPYMIREWRDDAAIARTAGSHVLQFLGLLRDAAREVNPDFRVITRLESFYGEHETVWAGLGRGIEVETTSLIARGWEMPYRHPRYADSSQINGGSVYQLEYAPRERELTTELASRGATAHYYFSAGPHQMFAPLLGVPYPHLTWQRLRLLHSNGVTALANVGGTCPPELVPFNVNHEVMRRMQFEPALDIDRTIDSLAGQWAGSRFAPALRTAWADTEEAILAFPNTSTLYATIGFTWYRLWVRPFVPNIEAIPVADRAYYEDFMCTTPHNPNNVDLSRDVLFQLTSAAKSRLDVERMDTGVWPPLDRAIAVLAACEHDARAALGPGNVIADQLVRLRALRCWMITHRNLAAWVAGVYGWMEATTAEDRSHWRAVLDDMMTKEIANCADLIALLDSGVEFMATTGEGESPLMHGRNLRTLLVTRIALMRRHAADDPYIDPGYMERMAGTVLG